MQLRRPETFGASKRNSGRPYAQMTWSRSSSRTTLLHGRGLLRYMRRRVEDGWIL